MNNEPPKPTLREAAEMAVEVLKRLGYDAVDLRNALAAPVRTKDLTDDEICDVWVSCEQSAWNIKFARAVIAADREKNR